MVGIMIFKYLWINIKILLIKVRIVIKFCVFVNSSSAFNKNYLGFAEGKINMTLSFKEAGSGNNSKKK